MIIPNSSFSIAIMYDNTKASWISLLMVKIYLIVYSLVEYPDQYKEHFECCIRFIKRKFLNEEI